MRRDSITPPVLEGSGSPVIHAVPNDGTVFAEIEPDANDDRLIRTLTVVLTSQTLEGETAYRMAVVKSSTVDNGSDTDRQLIISLRSAIWNGSAFVTPEDEPGYNIARLLHQGYDRPWWQFNLSTGPSNNLRGEWRPGDLMCITAAGSDLASAYAIVQVVTRDLFTGNVSVETGAPTHRGLGEWAKLRASLKEKEQNQKPQDTTWGFDKTKGEGPTPGGGGTGATGPTIWNAGSVAALEKRIRELEAQRKP